MGPILNLFPPSDWLTHFVMLLTFKKKVAISSSSHRVFSQFLSHLSVCSFALVTFLSLSLSLHLFLLQSLHSYFFSSIFVTIVPFISMLRQQYFRPFQMCPEFVGMAYVIWINKFTNCDSQFGSNIVKIILFLCLFFIHLPLWYPFICVPVFFAVKMLSSFVYELCCSYSNSVVRASVTACWYKKRRPICFKSCPKISLTGLHLKSYILQNNLKNFRIFGLLFWKYLQPRSFKNVQSGHTGPLSRSVAFIVEEFFIIFWPHKPIVKK